jgi:hypothetical protein
LRYVNFWAIFSQAHLVTLIKPLSEKRFGVSASESTLVIVTASETTTTTLALW